VEIYQVKSGDTLSKIARDVIGNLSRWPEIAKLNNLVEPYTIFPGMQLVMPNSRVIDVVVTKGIEQTGPPAPPAATFAGFNMTPQMWLYLGLAALALLLLNPPRK